MASSKPEVIIIGAGPVGLTAALELKRRGIHPRIIDKTSGPAAQSRALGVNPRTLDILEPSGVTHQLLAVGNRLQRAFIVESGKTLFTLRIERLKHDRPFMLIVPQSETERILIHALQDRGVEVEWNTELMELSQVDDEVTAVIAMEDDISEVTPDILIAADGAYSTARQCTGLSFAGSPYPVVFALADVHYQQPRDPTAATIELVSGGAVASFPMDAHTIRHVGTSADVVSLVRSRRSGSEVIWDSEFHVSFRHVSTFNSGSVFLAGDAAHIHSPVGARGMNLGIEDAAWLAWLIETGETDRYTSYRLPAAKRVINFTRQQTNQLFQSGPFVGLLRRTLAPAMLAIPFIEQMALRRLTGLDTPPPPWLAGDTSGTGS
ncbi:MAG: FAD-dependent oxidoreductase [Hyphomicrobiaceae bacterium]